MVNTGDGKGKTTAALGLALRAVGHGQQVCIIQFMKGDPNYGELQALRQYLPMIRLESTGTTDFVDRDNPTPTDLDEAERGIVMAEEAVQQGYNLVILDEINVAIDFGLIPLERVLRLIKNRPPHSHLLLTGRYAPQPLLDLADTVSTISDTKHHFYKGIPAQPGIEH